MKKWIVSLTGLAAFAALAPQFALAAADHDMHAGHGAMHADAAKSALTDGVIKRADKAGGSLVVSHGPLPNGMPGMTMAFKVKEASWLDKVKEGQKIRFAVETTNGTMTIVRLEMAN